MMNWVQENWIICLVAVLLVMAFVWWLRSRSKPVGPGEAVMIPPAPPKKPLEPAKPDIVPAEPARFKAAEPVKASAPPPAPAPTPAPAAAPPAGKSDNLQLLKGVGPKLATLLTGLGVTSFEQIAGWSDADIADIDSRLGTFEGRVTRDNWVDQAGYLARGDKAGFEAKYGVLGGEL